MRMRNLYLVLFLSGLIIPSYYLIMFFIDHGWNFNLMLNQVFSNHISSFFAWNGLIAIIVLLLFIFSDVTRETIKYLWICIVVTILFGVAAGLPFFLFLRECYLEENGSVNNSVIIDE